MDETAKTRTRVPPVSAGLACTALVSVPYHAQEPTRDGRAGRGVSSQMVRRNSRAGCGRPDVTACGTLARPAVVAVDVGDGRRMLLESLARVWGQAAEHGGRHGQPRAVELRRDVHRLAVDIDDLLAGAADASHGDRPQ